MNYEKIAGELYRYQIDKQADGSFVASLARVPPEPYNLLPHRLKEASRPAARRKLNKHIAYWASALLLSLSLPASATTKAPAAKCEQVQQGDAKVWAKRLPSGNYSTSACEVEITVRYTKRTARSEIRPTTSPWHCTVWVNPVAVPPVDLDTATAGCEEALDKAGHR